LAQNFLRAGVTGVQVLSQKVKVYGYAMQCVARRMAAHGT